MDRCPACKSLAPVWDQLAVKLEGKVNVAKVGDTFQNEHKWHWGVLHGLSWTSMGLSRLILGLYLFFPRGFGVVEIHRAILVS